MISLIIPCRNEEKDIAACLDSLLGNDYPKEQIEILILDGMSTDGTKAIIEYYLKQFPQVQLLENPSKSIPAAMNIGIKNAKGNIIMKIDAHSTYPKDYISKCIQYLNQYGADNVGGILNIVPRQNTAVARAIALVLAHPFGSGNARVKIGAKKPQWSDTAAFGCYKKEVFEKVGKWNEKLTGSSDLDFNLRLKKAGGKILLVPKIVIDYLADPTLKAFWLHNFADGVWATYVLKFGSQAWSLRHWIPLLFVISLISSAVLSALSPVFGWLLLTILGAYLITNVLISIWLTSKKGKLVYLWILPLTFTIRHLAHGFGALLGLFLLLHPGYTWQGRRTLRQV